MYQSNFSIRNSVKLFCDQFDILAEFQILFAN